MFTLDQIREAHSKVKSGADFPQYVVDLITLGVRKYDIFVHDGHGEYFRDDDYEIHSPAKYEPLTVAQTSNAGEFQERLTAHQQGQTDYQTFCTDAADAGVEKWTVDTEAMTCTYYGRSSRPKNNASEALAKEYDTAGNVMLEEEIPGV